jgi:hypothetical protein
LLGKVYSRVGVVFDYCEEAGPLQKVALTCNR